MSHRFPEHKSFSLPAFEREMLARWEEIHAFEKSVSNRNDRPSFTFYEGPPSANGRPGIHHVMARTIKDLVCRYKTLQGFQVKRKGGWDTHGLPVELQVEKRLGITKEDIGKTISIREYNDACREDVLKFKDVWDDITRLMGYWVDLENPYITFENPYIESVWNLLKRLWDKDLVYKGFTIQPYSPAAGTGLSSHELNLPGCYKEVKDTSAVAQFKAVDADEEYFLAWTTTPWTLPANTALAVGKNITYARVDTCNPYTGRRQRVILAKDLLGKYFTPDGQTADLDTYTAGDKVLPWRLLGEMKGSELVGRTYEQLLKYVAPGPGPAFQVWAGDFVSTEDGTGIVHIAPTFGSDDFFLARQNGIPMVLVEDEEGRPAPIVDKQGRFVKEITDYAGRFVKDYGPEPEPRSVDIDISVRLKEENKAFRVEKYEHNYPHCWRTDKPVLYYPLDSWFIRTTAAREKLIAHNQTINWKPASTGSGRFGNWLENLVDWNLSRSRYWGVPLPVWSTEDGTERVCVGSVDELRSLAEQSVAAGLMDASVPDAFFANLDLHKPGVDELIFVSPSGKPMVRESDLIDVWFDSGAMPFAQWHYPFENQDIFKASFPADFISEGVDQTRGWFFTLHAIAVMLEDSPAFKNVISTGLLLDKEGKKMSKRLGNIVDPFETIHKYGADATRWYMIGNAPPWENLKFDLEGVNEVLRKYFGTLYNTYGFFSLYANIAGYQYDQPSDPATRTDILDRWIVSYLHSLIQEVATAMDDYDPTRAVRAIDYFVNEQLSNWYVRQSRRRFWDGNQEAFDTLYECLKTVSVLMSPFAPFYADRLYLDLTDGKEAESVHLTDFPAVNTALIDPSLERVMDMAQHVTSLVHSIRKKEKLRVRQPLQRVLLALNDRDLESHLNLVDGLIASEVNVKQVEFLPEDSTLLIRKVKPNFRVLGPKAGPRIKEIGAALAALDQDAIRQLEQAGHIELDLPSGAFPVEKSEVEILNEDIPGWSVASDGPFTLALDVTLNEDLLQEGIAREFVSRIQNLRKTKGFEVTDRIKVRIAMNEVWNEAVNRFASYIADETLSLELTLVPELASEDTVEINEISGAIELVRVPA